MWRYRGFGISQFVLGFGIFLAMPAQSQELFVYTEPASNMPSNGLSTRLASVVYTKEQSVSDQVMWMPEAHYGLSSKVMVQGQLFLTQNATALRYQGANVGVQYKFLNQDALHKHFRMATFGRVGWSTMPAFQENIETGGMDSGFEIGITATQLLHKIAISGGSSWEQARDRTGFGFPNSALNYSLSIGNLLLPKKYVNYNQTNLNAMVEFLGQRIENGTSYLDIAPSVQFIFFSKARLDLAYRHALYDTSNRQTGNSLLLRLEYNFYNVF